APCEYRIEQLLLVVEIVIEQRVMDADALGDILERHPIKAVPREQIFRRVENMFGRFRAALGLGQAFLARFLDSRHVQSLRYSPQTGPGSSPGRLSPGHSPISTAFCRS